MNATPNRQPKGQPTGGQFAARSNPESDIELASPQASVRPLSEIETDLDRLRSEAQTAAVSEMSAVVLEQYPDATHVRLDTLYVDSNAYATAGAVQLADGTVVESGDMYPEAWDAVEGYAGTVWPDCEYDEEDSMIVPLVPPGSARTTTPARPEGTVEHEAHWVGGVRQRPAICMACGASVSQDDHGTWIDETGGDVCGVDGDNAPHIVEAAFGVGAGGPGVAAASQSAASPARQPKGQPAGGQFAAKANPEGEAELDEPQPISEVDPDGIERWYLNGRLHRTDGPAIVDPDGSQWWYENGKLHRTDGPAIIFPNGSGSWYLNGERQSPPVRR